MGMVTNSERVVSPALQSQDLRHAGGLGEDSAEVEHADRGPGGRENRPLDAQKRACLRKELKGLDVQARILAHEPKEIRVKDRSSLHLGFRDCDPPPGFEGMWRDDE